MEASPTPARALKRVLIGDDEPTIRVVVAEALSEVGYAVDTATNGAEALERMRANVPDVLIVDLMMPTLDAAGLVNLMRLNPDFAEIPIIVLSAAYDAEAGAAQLGAVVCLTKPFDLDHLLFAVGELVGEPELSVPETAPATTYEEPPSSLL